MNRMPLNGLCVPDAHAHGAPGANDGVFRLWNIGDPSCAVPEPFYFSAGIHPWDAGKYDLAAFAPLFDSPRCLAIGECGLDALRGPSMDIQEQVFLQQIALSEELKKPLIIHCVKALDRLLQRHKEQKPAMPWMFHGFRGKPQQLRSLLDAGFYVSFGCSYNEESLCLCPLGRMMLETDDRVGSIVELYNNVAEKRGLEVAELCKRMAENYQTFFQKEPLPT